jgi:dipeptide/tripeptide permease
VGRGRRRVSTPVALERESAPQQDWCGHPRQLWMLLAVAVGLNFGFYGFRAFLAPYIAQSFYAGLGQAAAQRHADLLTSGLLALMYATPIVGGYLADKVLVALSYGLIAWAIRHALAPDGKLGWGVLAGCYWLQTLGELAINPIGYSLIGLLAAPQDASLAMGGWYFGFALAYQLAGWIATFTAASAQTGIAAYAQVYERLFVAGIVVSVLYLIAAPKVQKLMHGVH